jgi:hypothetical protein
MQECSPNTDGELARHFKEWDHRGRDVRTTTGRDVAMRFTLRLILLAVVIISFR